MKVLIVSPNSEEMGGISTVIKLYKECDLLKNKAIFLTSYCNKSLILKFLIFFSFILNLLFKLCFDKTIKIVHVHSSYKGSFYRKAITLFITKIFRKKTIFHLHGSKFDDFYYKSNKIMKKIIKIVLDKCDLIIVLSERWKNILFKMTDNKNIKVLYNPIKLNGIFQKNNEKLNVIFMGRIGERKGVYDIIEASKYINSNVQINLYGDGEIYKVKNIIKNEKLDNIITVNNWVFGDEKLKIFKKADLLILPSYNEGLPMSILEALSFGIPVIATDVGGIKEAVINNINGYLISINSSKELASKINYLSQNRDLCKTMGEKSFEIAKEKFFIDKIIEELCGYYNELID